MKKILYLLLPLCFAETVFAQTTYSTGLAFDDDAYTQMPVRKPATNRGSHALPAKVSLKPYCPTPKSQGEYSNCVGWAVGYAACTISEAIITEALTDKMLNINAIDAIATSPTYIYKRIKPSNDTNCNSKAAMEEVLKTLKDSLLPRYQDFGEDCAALNALPKAFKTGVQIESFVRLFQSSDSKKQKLYAIKQTLANKKPVVIGIWHYKSFEKAKKVWSGDLSKYSGSGHAVCLTGYDDNWEGGTVEVMNSWGTEWGEGGFSRIRYRDLDTILKYAYEITLDGCLTTQKMTTPTFRPQKDTFLNASIELKRITDSSTMPIQWNPRNNTSKSLETHYQTVQTYPSGTQYQVILDHSEPIYLYVLSSDLTGQLDKLFPVQSISPFLTNPKAPFTLPDEHWYIETDDRVGKDFLIFLVSKTALNPIEDWVAQWNTQLGSALEKITKTLSSRIQSFQNKKDLQNKISFRAKLESEKIILLTIAMPHD